MPHAKRRKPRAYHSPLRRASATRTREAIVAAAVRLHARGITALGAVADEAGVSLPTVAKYFPNRERLFEACTGHAVATTEYPSAETLAAIADPAERVARIVRETLALHEKLFGLSWTGYRLAGDSPVMAAAVRDYEAAVASLADAVFGADAQAADDGTRGMVRALLAPLAYRALRQQGGLDPEAAIEQTARALQRLLDHRS